MSKTCKNCGEPLGDVEKVCPKCGMLVEDNEEVKVEESLEDTAELPVQEESSETNEDEKVYVVEKSSIIGNIFFTLLVIILLGAAAFAYCFFQHPDYLDTAFGYIGFETNFARNVEIEGTYGQKPTATPTITISPSPTSETE